MVIASNSDGCLLERMACYMWQRRTLTRVLQASSWLSKNEAEKKMAAKKEAERKEAERKEAERKEAERQASASAQRANSQLPE